MPAYWEIMFRFSGLLQGDPVRGFCSLPPTGCSLKKQTRTLSLSVHFIGYIIHNREVFRICQALSGFLPDFFLQFLHRGAGRHFKFLVNLSLFFLTIIGKVVYNKTVETILSEGFQLCIEHLYNFGKGRR